jgi:hypothetical protein
MLSVLPKNPYSEPIIDAFLDGRFFAEGRAAAKTDELRREYKDVFMLLEPWAQILIIETGGTVMRTDDSILNPGRAWPIFGPHIGGGYIAFTNKAEVSADRKPSQRRHFALHEEGHRLDHVGAKDPESQRFFENGITRFTDTPLWQRLFWAEYRAQCAADKIRIARGAPREKPLWPGHKRLIDHLHVCSREENGAHTPIYKREDYPDEALAEMFATYAMLFPSNGSEETGRRMQARYPILWRGFRDHFIPFAKRAAAAHYQNHLGSMALYVNDLADYLAPFGHTVARDENTLRQLKILSAHMRPKDLEAVFEMLVDDTLNGCVVPTRFSAHDRKKLTADFPELQETGDKRLTLVPDLSISTPYDFLKRARNTQYILRKGHSLKTAARHMHKRFGFPAIGVDVIATKLFMERLIDPRKFSAFCYALTDWGDAVTAVKNFTPPQITPEKNDFVVALQRLRKKLGYTGKDLFWALALYGQNRVSGNWVAAAADFTGKLNSFTDHLEADTSQQFKAVFGKKRRASDTDPLTLYQAIWAVHRFTQARALRAPKP